MNWELAISIAGLVTGGGCLLWIFNAGIWKGEVSTKIEQMNKSLGELTDGISGKVKSEIGQTSTTISQVAVGAVEALRSEMDGKIARVHLRLDDKASNGQQTENRLEVVIAGLQSQRQEWDTLRSDIRTLLRSEATTTNEIANFKERLAVYEVKMSASMEKIARVESDVAHLNAARKK